METRLNSFDVASEVLLESCIALVNLFVGIGAPATAAGEPGSEAAAATATAVKNAFIASSFDLILKLTHVVYE